MKTFPLGDTLLIGAVPDRVSGAEAQALFEQIEEWFSQARPRQPSGTNGRVHTGIGIYYFEENLTSQTSKETKP